MNVPAAACTKASQHGIYDIVRIERMLKNGVEQNVVQDDFETLLGNAPRFARDGNYFKNYN